MKRARFDIARDQNAERFFKAHTEQAFQRYQ